MSLPSKASHCTWDKVQIPNSGPTFSITLPFAHCFAHTDFAVPQTDSVASCKAFVSALGIWGFSGRSGDGFLFVPAWKLSFVNSGLNLNVTSSKKPSLTPQSKLALLPGHSASSLREIFLIDLSFFKITFFIYLFTCLLFLFPSP